jgi:hypothetical protein
VISSAKAEDVKSTIDIAPNKTFFISLILYLNILVQFKNTLS